MSSMNITELKEEISKEISKIQEKYKKDFKRVFHGRGNYHDYFEYLTVDSIDNTLLAVFFDLIDASLKQEIIEVLKDIANTYKYENLVIQNRYDKENLFEEILGTIPNSLFAREFNLDYKLSFKYQNTGFFADMKNGRKFVKRVSKNKKVLNLFSYTCSFSVAALSNDASLVVNVDMSKASLNTGKINHELNNLDTKKAKFMPFDILKSWSKIKKFAPYDVIIIDPPSFQKGSFEASNDYQKIVRRLDSLADENCIVLACLNDPKLDENFIINIFDAQAPNFKHHSVLNNPKSFKSAYNSKALKNLVFTNYK